MKKILFLFAASLLIMNGLLAQDTAPAPHRETALISPVYPKEGKQEEGDTLSVVQVKANFPGGDKEYYKFVTNNLKYPSSALQKGIEGTVYVKFVVDKDGSIIKKTIKVAKSIDPELDAEALRVVNLSPNWTIPMQDNLPVMQRIRIPMKFKIAK